MTKYELIFLITESCENEKDKNKIIESYNKLGGKYTGRYQISPYDLEFEFLREFEVHDKKNIKEECEKFINKVQQEIFGNIGIIETFSIIDNKGNVIFTESDF